MSMEYNKTQDKLSDIFKEAREFKILKEENQRLKAQLDREIKINRKMKSCLSAFARRDNWKAIEGCADWLFLLDPLMAEETLKEIDNKE